MFTGIVTAIGRVLSCIRNVDNSVTLNIAVLDKQDLLLNTELGDSIAVNGCCLTVTSFEKESFKACLSPETLKVTTLGHLKEGALVNLEKAVTVGQALGGHWVSGHVDAVASVSQVVAQGECREVSFNMPESLMHYFAEKGSITIDGVSLTVNTVKENEVQVMLVPHTLKHTVLAHYEQGTLVNVEVDVLARYVERMMACQKLELVHD